MKKLANEKIVEVQTCLYQHISESIYLTIDLEKYGVSNPQAQFWYDETNGQIDTVVMKYYDSFQIFSSNPQWNPEETAELARRYEVTTICGKKSMIECLIKMLPEYEASYGVIVRENTYREFPQFSLIEEAHSEDAMEIAQLMCTDEDFDENYEVEILAKQLADRMEDNSGRSFVIREDGKIVAHTSVFAENNTIAVESGLIVDKDYKDKLYGMMIHEYLKKKLLAEGKTIYGFRIKDSMKRCTKASKDNVCGYYGKMTRRK